MKKKIIIICVIVLLFIISICVLKINYNKNVLTEIESVYNKLKEENNIYYESIRTENNDSTYKMWVKDSKIVVIINNLKYYADFENEEYYQQQENEMVKVEEIPTLLKNGIVFTNLPALFMDSQEIDELSLKNLLIDINIKSENYNGTECYKISYGNEITYCEKETLLPIKKETYHEGEVFEVNTYKISYDTVTDDNLNFENLN